MIQKNLGRGAGSVIGNMTEQGQEDSLRNFNLFCEA